MCVWGGGLVSELLLLLLLLVVVVVVEGKGVVARGRVVQPRSWSSKHRCTNDVSPSYVSVVAL